ncbi:MAG: ribonuclease D [Wenzhouxiangellaceae bacterium]|nr:ribonuclease D [Wenzhouxiangellaceae bacterium]
MIQNTGASFANPPHATHHLCDSDHIEEHASQILSSDCLGVDTEFVRERTFFPIPGLIQISNGEQVWLLDPVALHGEPAMAKFLTSLMNRGSTQKILHSAAEDFEVIDLLCATLPVSLFDTQIAAAMLGWPLQLRYETLAQELLGVEFPGGLGRNNWLRRPLPEAWVEYASNDVIALPAMRDELTARLQKAGRLAWFEQECRSLIARYGVQADPAGRINGAARLDDAGLARLSRLALWRDQQARKRDLPRSFVVTDAALLNLAQNPPRQPQGLDGMKDISPGLARKHGAELIEILNAPAGSYARPALLELLSAKQRERIKKLQQQVREAAEGLGVEPALIASKRDLTRWVQGAPSIDMDGWRREVLGSDFGQ